MYHSGWKAPNRCWSSQCRNMASQSSSWTSGHAGAPLASKTPKHVLPTPTPNRWEQSFSKGRRACLGDLCGNTGLRHPIQAHQRHKRSHPNKVGTSTGSIESFGLRAGVGFQTNMFCFTVPCTPNRIETCCYWLLALLRSNKNPILKALSPTETSTQTLQCF